MQGGLHPDLKIDWHENMLRGIKQRFPQIHLHCFSASEILAIAEVQRAHRARHHRRACATPASTPSPAAAPKFSTTKSATRIARLKCLTDDWINVHRTAHQLGMRTTATMMFGVGESFEHRVNHFEAVYRLQEETGGSTVWASRCWSR